MSADSLKVDCAMEWHRRFGHLNQPDVFRNATEGQLEDVCILYALAIFTTTPVPRVAETLAEEKLERVFTDVMGAFRVESLPGFGFRFFCRPVLEVCVCGLA